MDEIEIAHGRSLIKDNQWLGSSNHPQRGQCIHDFSLHKQHIMTLTNPQAALPER